MGATAAGMIEQYKISFIRKVTKANGINTSMMFTPLAFGFLLDTLC